MRYKPDDDEDRQKKIEEYAVEPWMMDQLDRNWDYLGWGPQEDYMTGQPWDPDSARSFPTWGAFRKAFTLGHFPESHGDRSGGEVVGWYFNLERNQRECRECDGSGLNPATKRLNDDWYDFDETGRRWCDKLVQEEVDKLLEEGRLNSMVHVRTREALDKLVETGRLTAERAEELWEGRDKEQDRHDDETGELKLVWVRWRDSVPLEEINASQHDAINRWICVKDRAERLGVYGLCPRCDGDGMIPVDITGRLQLVLWVINPLTGQSYGLEIDNVDRRDMADVDDFLAGVRTRLVERLDMPEDVVNRRDFGAGETMMWTQAGSVLERSGKGWASETVFDSWKEFCWPTNWQIGAEADDYRIPEDHPEFAKQYTGDPQWTLDDLNELVRVCIGRDPHGRRVERVYLWMILPRKGASKRITVNNVREEDLPSLRRWVQQGVERARRRLDPGVTPEE